MFSYSLAPERPQKATVFLPRRHADPINDLGPPGPNSPCLLDRPDSSGGRSTRRSRTFSYSLAPDARERFRVCSRPSVCYVSEPSGSRLTLSGIVKGSKSPGAMASSPRRTMT
jgi:hypothetical protein